jgi:hypothetical protein
MRLQNKYRYIIAAAFGLLFSACKSSTVVRPPAAKPNVEIILDITGSTANEFDSLLAKAQQAFVRLPRDIQYEVLALRGSSSNLDRLSTGVVPEDLDPTTEKTRKDIADTFGKAAKDLFNLECASGEAAGSPIQCKDSRSCIYGAVRDRLRRSANEPARPMTIIFFTDAMEDCEYLIQDSTKRVNLKSFLQAKDAIAMLQGLPPLDMAQQSQAKETSIYFCLPKKILQGNTREKDITWLEEFWRSTLGIGGGEWRHFGIDDKAPEIRA